MVMMVMVTVVTSCGSERRTGKHHQEERCCENLFHALNVARFERAGKSPESGLHQTWKRTQLASLAGVGERDLTTRTALQKSKLE
jgi:hypothetical protein